MAEPEHIVDRDPEEPEDPRRAHVTLWQERILADKEHWKNQFKAMRDMQAFAKGRTQTKSDDEGSYVANITQRHLKQRVAELYAKDPRVTFRRRKRMHGKVWDGRAETLVAARDMMGQVNQLQQIAAQGPEEAAAAQIMGQQLDPEMVALAQQIILEADLAQQVNVYFDRVGRTLEIVYLHQVGEQSQRFKARMKQQVRRALTTGVGYVKIGYQRSMKMEPDIQRQHEDATNRLAQIRQLSADLHDDEIQPEDAETDSLISMLRDFERQPMMLVREGLTFNFPRSTAIIPDQRLEYLPTFAGCEYVTEEFMLTQAQIQQVYGVHVSSSAIAFEKTDSTGAEFRQQIFKPTGAEKSFTFYRVWQAWSKAEGLVYTLCEGHHEFLEEPREPDVYIEQFFPWFPIVTNAMDDDDDPFPISDVKLMMPMQEELNRGREGLREHRFAARPKTVTAAGMLTNPDKAKLQNHEANAIIELQSLAPGAKVDDLLQPYKGPPIDPNLYETGPVFQDILRVLGKQEANIGGVNNATATENSIAESSRLEAQGSESDDLDEVLTELARAGGAILLLNMSEETVKQIAGDGAIWPQVNRETVAEEIYLEAEAGSAGRPNQSADLQTLERVIPLAIQIPGVSPYFIARRLMRALDQNVEIEDALLPSSPSILALNGMVMNQQPFNSDGDSTQQFDNGAGAPAGDSLTNPAAQGPQGALNAPAPVGPLPGGRSVQSVIPSLPFGGQQG